MQSAIYEGFINHHRFQPKPHAFRYPVFMIYLKLAELDTFFRLSPWWSRERFNWASFYRRDFLNPSITDLTAAVQQEIFTTTGKHFAGDIFLLTHIRYLGYCFNPVSFYYCYADNRLTYIVAEINNTPWRERFCYVLCCDPESKKQHFSFAKAFHVSPFLPMDMEYQWRFSLPDEQLSVFMRNRTGDRDIFHAHLQLARQEATTANLNRILRRFPAVTLKTTAGIYWQAFQLWRKRTPFHNHPPSSEALSHAIIHTASNHSDQSI